VALYVGSLPIRCGVSACRLFVYIHFGHPNPVPPMTQVIPIPLAVGIYSQADAARLLGMTASRLRRWVNGYTYWLRSPAVEQRRSKPPVIQKSDLPIIDGRVALSFLELMELRVVKALVDKKGFPLQTIRAKAALAQGIFETPHPFASRRVFVEQDRLFAELGTTESLQVIELSKGKTLQVVLGELIPMLDEIDFDEDSSLARTWWPLGKSEPIVLDRRIAFGAPTIYGSRVRTNIAAEMARRNGVQITAEAFGVREEGVDASVRFEQLLAAA
jgi:uncharacterized protein (DUF433 family)